LWFVGRSRNHCGTSLEWLDNRFGFRKRSSVSLQLVSITLAANALTASSAMIAICETLITK
jgi:hypothetical protein